MNLPDLELVAAAAHQAWLLQKLATGVRSRTSETGEELMVPYDQLSEPAKDLDRACVRAVYDAIQAVSPPTTQWEGRGVLQDGSTPERMR
jgi:hypothetical protein